MHVAAAATAAIVVVINSYILSFGADTDLRIDVNEIFFKEANKKSSREKHANDTVNHNISFVCLFLLYLLQLRHRNDDIQYWFII